MQVPVYEKKGYLNEDYRLFFISGRNLPKMDYHYHEFHKILLLTDGKAGYGIEGRHYDLEKNDIMLVGSGCVHRPEVKQGELYSRTVLYISPEFVKNHSTPETDLELCFPKGDKSHLIRFVGAEQAAAAELFQKLETAYKNSGYGSDVICQSLILQLLVMLARENMKPEPGIEGVVNDLKILEILTFINENICTELTIDALADKFFISKFHMMRRFKSETGYTIHNYVINKRLLAAKQLISNGEAATSACYKCGFRDYSTFSRAYKKTFEESPGGRSREEKELKI